MNPFLNELSMDIKFYIYKLTGIRANAKEIQAPRYNFLPLATF